MERTVFVEMERRCNLRCRYCFAWQEAWANPLAAPDSVARLLEFLQGLRRLDFSLLALTGGEPTLHPALPQVAQAARRMGYRVTLLTNGVGLTDELIGQLAAELAEVYISLDAPTDAANRDLRCGTGPVLGTIRAFRRRGLAVEINCVLTRRNLDSVPALLALARAEGCTVAVMPVYLPAGHPDARALGLDHLMPAERRQLANVLGRLSAFDPERRQFYRFLAGRYLAGVRYHKPHGCSFGQDALVVRQEGELFPCFHRPESYGNFLSGDLSDLIDRIALGQGGSGPCFGEHCYSLQAILPDLGTELCQEALV